MKFNPDLLEPEAAALFEAGALPLEAMQLPLLLSVAISLRRIADLGEPINVEAHRDAPISAPNVVPMVEIVRDSGKASPAPRRKPPASAAVFAPVAIPQGFDTHDGGAIPAGIDRNWQIECLHRNGKRRKFFAGSVAWEHKDEGDDVLAWRVLGDGATVASAS